MAGARKRCLIVDDSYDSCLLLQKAIQEQFESDLAQDGFAAQQHLSHRKYDIVLSDIQMPLLNGFDLLKELKKKYIHMPIIFVTGDASSEVSREALNLGAANLVQKPVDFKDLMEKMQTAIRLNESEDTTSCSQQELGHIYSQLKLYYYDIQDILFQINYYNIPMSVVREELEKKEKLGKCFLDDPQNIKFLAKVAS